MYISAFLVAMSICVSNTYEGKSLGIYQADPDGDPDEEKRPNLHRSTFAVTAYLRFVVHLLVVPQLSDTQPIRACTRFGPIRYAPFGNTVEYIK